MAMKQQGNARRGDLGIRDDAPRVPVLGLVIVGIILGIRWLVYQGRPEISDSALEILRQRYARGEINREEFEAKRKDLQR